MNSKLQREKECVFVSARKKEKLCYKYRQTDMHGNNFEWHYLYYHKNIINNELTTSLSQAKPNKSCIQKNR